MEESLDLDTIMQIIEHNRQQRVRDCWEAIQQALAQYRCQIRVAPALTPDGRIEATLRLQAE